MDKKIFFSIIIPAYNRKRFLEKAIDSVLSQTIPAFELIIVDDGSTDGTKDIVLSRQDHRIKYLYQNNRGVSSARNKGLREATGNFIAFLDSDDWWAREKLKKAVTYIHKYPGIKIFHTEETWFKNGQFLKQMAKHRKPTGWVYTDALPLCCISISTAVINRSVFNDIGYFDESLEACEDYDFWLRATNKYEVKLIPEALTLKDGGRPDQLSSRVWGLDRFRIIALEKMLKSGDLTEEKYKKTFQQLSRKCGIFSLGAEKRGKTKEAEYYKKIMEKYKPGLS
jgi:glycosyltransferase involved in cell wall biosynthesis